MSIPTPPGGNFPRAALTAAACLVGLVVALVAILAVSGSLNDKATPLVVSIIGMVAGVVPGLVAATYAERASRDIRNGTVVEKAREGAVKAFHDPQAKAQVRQAAVQALEDAQVVTRVGPVVTAEVAALAELVGLTRQIRDHTATTAAQGPPDAPQTGGSHRA